MGIVETSEQLTHGTGTVDGPHTLRVLVVDDNEDWLEPMASVLGRAGHEVWTASNGEDALAILSRNEVDVAIFDIGLPGMDGYVLARRVRAQLGRAAPRLIALTGYSDEDDRARSERAGFAQHMPKPVDVKALLAAVGRSPRSRQPTPS